MARIFNLRESFLTPRKPTEALVLAPRIGRDPPICITCHPLLAALVCIRSWRSPDRHTRVPARGHTAPPTRAAVAAGWYCCRGITVVIPRGGVRAVRSGLAEADTNGPPYLFLCSGVWETGPTSSFDRRTAVGALTGSSQIVRQLSLPV